nr:hypothetical protein [Tanacetum cinerariifolium]
MTHLLEKETPFIFSKECIEAFEILKKKLTEAPILVAPDWDLPFEIMCDASDFVVGAVLGQPKALPINDARVIVKFLKSLFARFGTLRAIISDRGENRASWSDKLDDALWAFRIAFKTPIGCTPYKLVYGKAFNLPIELEHKAHWALKHCNFDLKFAGDHQKV